MQEMNQGEDYEEQGFGEEFDYEDEGTEDTHAGFDTFWGIPKKMFFIGVAVAVILLLGAVLIMTRGRSSSDEDDPSVLPDTTLTTDDTFVDTTNVTTQCYDASGNLIGSCDGLTDGFSIYDENYNDIGYIDAAGSMQFYDSTGNLLGSYSPAGNSGDSSSTDPISVSEDDKLLRKMGYTGDEIELAKSTGVSVDTLVEAAEALHDEAAKEALTRMSDSASEEFQHIVNNSIFCMPEVQFEAFDSNVDSSRKYTGSYIVNADYEKVPTYGNQLWIKVKIANGTFAFYLVTPERWETLPDTGNIVMQVSYTMYGTNNINMYITDLNEIDTTKITVNPEDSGAELSDILSDTSAEYQDSDLNGEEGTESSENVNWW